MERSQKKIHRKDKLTWPAHILTCSPHVLSHVLALNSTSLLSVTCPCKNQVGWPFLCPYRNVVFFGLEPCTGRPTLKSHRSKLGLRSTSSNAIIYNETRTHSKNWRRKSWNGHVVLPGTPEHRNTGTPGHPRTSRNIPNTPKKRGAPPKTQNTPQNTRNTSENQEKCKFSKTRSRKHTSCACELF